MNKRILKARKRGIAKVEKKKKKEEEEEERKGR